MSFMKYVYRKVVIYVLINFQKSYSFSLYMYFFTMSEGPESTGGLGSSMATSGFGMDPDIARKIYYDTLCYQSVTFFFLTFFQLTLKCFFQDVDTVWNPRVPGPRNHPEQGSQQSRRLVVARHPHLWNVGGVREPDKSVYTCNAICFFSFQLILIYDGKLYVLFVFDAYKYDIVYNNVAWDN